MRLRFIALGTGLFGAAMISAAKAGLPVDKVYGVNLGSWLLSEPWMFPKEWVEKMGGESCDDCSQCAASEFDLVKKLGQTQADKVFAEHWSTWFTQKDVDDIAAAGLNTVRIPLGYWIIEDLVDRNSEFYPKGGLTFLKSGLRMLKAKGIHIILDFHAMPGVAAVNQMFAGRCTSDVHFYTEKNYERALTWAAVMTRMVYQDPDFSTVFAIEAVNEPVMDATKTPGYGDYQKRFVEVVRSVENEFGISCPGVDRARTITGPSSVNTNDIVVVEVLKKAANIMNRITGKPGLEPSYPPTHIKVPISFDDAEIAAIRQGHGAGRLALPMSGSRPAGAKRSVDGKTVPHGPSLKRYNAHRRQHRKRGVSAAIGKMADRTCLMTTFMNKDWQYNNPPNPADAANGPQLYDAHLYFSFGGVADPNPDSYMRTICNTDRVKKAYAEDNNPLVFGADAQRHIYAGQADGWIFWSHKIEEGSPYLPYWSYSAALKAGSALNALGRSRLMTAAESTVAPPIDKLGGYEFYEKVLKSPKYVVAPMVDQSELAWRVLSRKYDAQLAYTPMINAKMFAGNHRRGYQELNFNIANGEEGGELDRPLIVQFCGNDPENLLESALVVQDHCDAVDINFGCPQDIAKKGHYGSFLQDDWDLVYKLINILHTNLKVPVTAKFRIFPDVNKTVEYAKMMERAGAQIVTCHGRTREQRGTNTGLADWTQIAAVKRALKIPVFANGNILYPEDVNACLEATGADGVMSAEANLYNPALFAGLPSGSSLKTGPRDHTDLAIEYLEIVKKLKTDTAPSAVKGHLFKLMRPALGREVDLRDRIGKVNPKGPGKSKEFKKSREWVDQYLEIVKELKTRMERDKISAALEDQSKGVLPLPHWFAQPYVRPPPVSAPKGNTEKTKAKKGGLAANLPPPEQTSCEDCPAEDAGKLEKAEMEVALDDAHESGTKRAATPTEVAGLETKRPRLENEPEKISEPSLAVS
ncbi:unnamed protein product [Rhizoctonia solani]|uniref:tRNA-dihydrouridine synthase 1 n=1 Tax=Rhizoctonia solani TaxID=456999 RepID=A0A8H2WBS9_9AGAM|nr:unnamed protein product [Rhizoctonia solani]